MEMPVPSRLNHVSTVNFDAPSVFGALLAAQLYLLMRDLAFDRRVAFLAAAATVFVHPFLTYTTQIYPDLIAAVVFVTAHDEHALRAFEAAAIDYLLKPVKRERLERTLDRLEGRRGDPEASVQAVLEKRLNWEFGEKNLSSGT